MGNGTYLPKTQRLLDEAFIAYQEARSKRTNTVQALIDFVESTIGSNKVLAEEIIDDILTAESGDVQRRYRRPLSLAKKSGSLKEMKAAIAEMLLTKCM